jgi:acyl carrier protein
MSQQIFEKVQRLASDLFDVPASRITPDSSPQTLEHWDSVQHLNLVLALEEEFNVKFEPEDSPSNQRLTPPV